MLRAAAARSLEAWPRPAALPLTRSLTRETLPHFKIISFPSEVNCLPSVAYQVLLGEGEYLPNK